MADAVMQAIEDTAKTGHIGDGKIFVLPLEAGREDQNGRSRRSRALTVQV